MENQSVTNTRSNEALRSAKRLIKIFRAQRKKGKLTAIPPSDVQELMNHLINLAESNQHANTLEGICGGAILHHEHGNYREYYDHLKEIIMVGENL